MFLMLKSKQEFLKLLDKYISVHLGGLIVGKQTLVSLKALIFQSAENLARWNWKKIYNTRMQIDIY